MSCHTVGIMASLFSSLPPNASLTSSLPTLFLEALPFLFTATQSLKGSKQGSGASFSRGLESRNVELPRSCLP